ncbi:hypothetical protein [Nonomuraea sp. LPB2021202275-12-8]|uniref:hypothetical protein n=1 Tax=Nonomuraea sp. LPB2021202275-12-8 TaxID=3120159 RepID=UPI00300D503D
MTSMGAVTRPVSGSVAVHTAASYGTNRRNLSEARLNSSSASPARSAADITSA